MNWEEYADLYEKINARVKDRTVAIAILQEIGKDARTPHTIRPVDMSKDEPATDKQKALMKKMKIQFPDAVTKKEASDMIDERMKK